MSLNGFTAEFKVRFAEAALQRHFPMQRSGMGRTFSLRTSKSQVDSVPKLLRQPKGVRTGWKGGGPYDQLSPASDIRPRRVL